MKRYVCGFLFSSDKQHVCLIRKAKPEWQAGFLNGVGGKIEPHEMKQEPVVAMCREFQEETGVVVPVSEWRKFAQLTHNDTPAWVVHFFVASGDYPIKTQDRVEPVAWFKVATLHPLAQRGHMTGGTHNIVPNLRWLIPLALEDDVNGILVQHNWPHPE